MDDSPNPASTSADSADLPAPSGDSTPVAIDVGVRVRMETLLAFSCMSCGGRVTLARVRVPKDGDGTDGDGVAVRRPADLVTADLTEHVADVVLLHDTPACALYLELDVVDFLQEHRRAAGITDAMADGVLARSSN
jgi:hypothetical protein